MTLDRRESAPAAERNKQPILEVLARVLPAKGHVLEIASGTGQHVAHFAKGLPHLTFQPSEVDADRHASIVAWIAHEKLTNVLPPIAFDVTRLPWPLSSSTSAKRTLIGDPAGFPPTRERPGAPDAIVCLNMIHISPWEATQALMRGAGEILPPNGVLVTYGPYRRNGAHTAPSNEAFDASLKARDPQWGVRDMEAVAGEASKAGLALEETVPMPANNFTLVFRKE